MFGTAREMNVLNQFLDGRDKPDIEMRRRAAEAWQLAGGKAPEVRLLAFDRWVRLELLTRLQWEWAGSQKERRIEQCRLRLEKVVLDLWRRGWMLDGRKLAARITELLDVVGKYQATGKVLDFWAYFGAAVDRYVGANAEEIQAEAMRAGTHVGQLLGALGITATVKEPALPELLAKRADEITTEKAETLRSKLTRARAQHAACKGGAGQAQLW
ncbi:MAG: hypothetical protein ABIZ04_20890 [Opitutus sp.]